MFSGEKINVTEQPGGAARRVASTRRCVDRGRRRERRAGGACGAPQDGRLLRTGARRRRGRATPASASCNVVNIGIGGSDLGPAMAYEALRDFSRRDMTFRLRVQRRRHRVWETLHGLDPERRCSSSARRPSRTLETLTNAHSARQWLLDALGNETRSRRSTSSRCRPTSRRVAEFGIDTANMFEFWDWVGGRYSVDSAIGLSLMLAIGAEQFSRVACRLPRDRRALPHRAVRAEPASAPRADRRLVHQLLRRRDAGDPAVQPVPRAWRRICSSSTWRATASRSTSTGGGSTTRPVRSSGASRAPTGSTRTTSSSTRARG